ncbi:metallophosphoesterase family protein [Halomonas denitrificans]|uniref:metallophosphoesterase family protein n=1 Tax=Halomonas denitrificans TaxID=370769 RepID=UPI001CD64115|nr:metallophosphoesterase [Halomonas denitrificans]MCA0976368.1 metallophosphoesterase family protein [Halomonas denitrificans]
MRLRILSDLHLEHFEGDRLLPDVEADMVILAGDIHLGLQGIEWAAARFPDQPVIYVPGNHEFYKHRMEPLRKEMRERAATLGIHLLDNARLELDGVRFLGTTLWTDFALYDERATPGDIPTETLSAALRQMPDFAIIEEPDGEVFSPERSVELHRENRAWLETELARPFAGATVVVSHHAPLAECIPAHYQGDPLSPAFASRLESLMEGVALWVHGHVHDPVMLTLGDTRVVAVPGGYPGERSEDELRLDRVVEVESMASQSRQA